VKLLDQLGVNKPLLDVLMAGATYRELFGFADFYGWSPNDPATFDRRLRDSSDPGVSFETKTRMFAVEEYDGEFRFYAGPADPHGQDDQSELGAFRSAEDVLTYAEAFLIRGLSPAAISVPRQHSRIA
jgi:hypothetical protein